METGEEQDVIAQQLPPIASSSSDKCHRMNLGTLGQMEQEIETPNCMLAAKNNM